MQFWYKIQVYWQTSLNKLHVEMWFIRLISINNCETQTSHRLTYPILIRLLYYRCCPGNVNDIYYHSMALIRSVSVTAGTFIFQIKTASSKSLKSIIDGLNSHKATPINDTNLVCSASFAALLPFLNQWSITCCKCLFWLYWMVIKRTLELKPML